MGWVYSGLEFEGLKRSYTDWQLLKRLIKEVIPFKLPFTLIAISVLFATFLSLLSPLILAIVIGQMEQNTLDQNIIIYGAGFYTILYILIFFMHYLQNIGIAYLVSDRSQQRTGKTCQIIKGI